MKYFQILIMSLLLLVSNAFAAESTVFRYSVDKPVSEVYDAVYSSLEEARFFVVFEANIGKNLAAFAERWGANYNRRGLSAIRSMVFCNAWYANQVSNLDPDMLGSCPLRLSLVEKSGKTTVLFNRPSVIAANSPALKVMTEVELEVIAAIKKAMR